MKMVDIEKTKFHRDMFRTTFNFAKDHGMQRSILGPWLSLLHEISFLFLALTKDIS